MQMPAQPFRKLEVVSSAVDGLFHRLDSQTGASLRLSEDDHRLARLFDGFRDARAILEVAAQSGIASDAARLEAFALRLAESGLLIPGIREPLPVPSQYGAGVSAMAPVDVLLPSTMPGTLTAPSTVGSLTGLWGRERGEAAPLNLALSPRRWLLVGSALNLMLFGRVRIGLLLALVIGAIAAMYNHRIEMGRDVVRLLQPLTLATVVVVYWFLISGLTELARAAAVARLTHSWPGFGITQGSLGIPRFHTTTAGAAERADRGARLQIVGAVLVSALTLFVAAVAMWLMTQRHGSLLAALSAGFAVAISVFVILQANPLTKRDGYNLLVSGLRVGDLREHAGYLLLGYERPWSAQRRPPRGVLFVYLGLVVLYLGWVTAWFLIFPAAWLKERWGPVGALLIVGLLARTVYLMFRRTYRSNLVEKMTVPASQPFGWISQMVQRYWRSLQKAVRGISRTWWYIIGGVVVFLLLPYPYDPSGQFVVLPNARADVRAQVAGEVRAVLVKEGDAVTVGQMIARLADEDEKAQVAGAEAALSKLQSNLADAKLGRGPEQVALAKALVGTAEKRYQFSRAEADRLANAFKRKAISEQEYQRALSAAEVNQQQLIESKRNADVVGSPARADELKALEAEVERQKSELNFQRIQLGYTEVRAPIAGRIVSGSLQFAVGDYLQRGAQLATIQDSEHLQVEIQISEDDVGQIEPGSKAWAKAWGAPGSAYSGRVLRIAPSAQDAPYGKVVRVYMSVDEPDERLKPAMTGYAKVRGHWYPLIVAFTRPLVRFVLVEIWSWLP